MSLIARDICLVCSLRSSSSSSLSKDKGPSAMALSCAASTGFSMIFSSTGDSTRAGSLGSRLEEGENPAIVFSLENRGDFCFLSEGDGDTAGDFSSFC